MKNWLVLTAFMVAGFLIRIIPPFSIVYSVDPPILTGVDAYFYMRQVDSLVANFPSALYYDPLLRFPWGMMLGTPHLFVLIMSGFSLISPLLTPIVPPLLGILTAIPVYLAAKSLFDNKAGLIAGCLIAILPGEFLGRSMLGFADRHVLDNLLMSLCFMGYVLALKEQTLNKKSITLALLSGLFTGLFVLGWKGSLFFVLLTAAAVCVLLMLGKANPILFGVSTLTAMAVALPIYSEPVYILSLVAALVAPLIVYLITKLPRRFAIMLFGLSVVVVTSLAFVYAGVVFEPIIGTMGEVNATMEMMPFFVLGKDFTLELAWGNFALAIFAFIPALFYLVYKLKAKREYILLIAWAVFLLISMVYARRFSQMLAPVICVCVGIGLSSLIGVILKVQRNRKHKAPKMWWRYAIVSILFLSLVIPNFILGVETTAQPQFALTRDWNDSLSWLKQNSPETIDYEGSYQFGMEYPKDAYTVLSWWDYGYWIARVGQRMPACDPGGGSRKPVAEFLVSSKEAVANQTADALSSKYVVLDDLTVLSKYHAVITLAGENVSKYYGQLSIEGRSVIFWFPAYYETMAVRLYNFDGNAVKASRVAALRLNGNQVTASRVFNTLIEAQAFVRTQQGSWVIGSDNPFQSCVDLPALKEWVKVYGNKVKVFEWMRH